MNLVGFKPFYMVTFQRLPIFHYFVYKSMGASSIGCNPTTLYILMHNFIISKRVGFNRLILKERKLIFKVAHHQKNLAQPYFANWRVLSSGFSSVLINILFRLSRVYQKSEENVVFTLYYDIS